MDPLRTIILRFLRAHPGGHCVECIAAEVRKPLSQVTMTVLGRTDRTTVNTTAGECTRCRRDRLLAKAA